MASNLMYIPYVSHIHTGSPPVPTKSDTVQDRVVSNKEMETNPGYHEMPSDQNRKGLDPAYQELSSQHERANVSKPAGAVNHYEDIND